MHNSIIWFGNDLRVLDNPNLIAACESSNLLIAVYILDPKLFKIGKWGFRKMEKYRANFLLESLQELEKNLEKLNIRLLVYVEKPENVLPALIVKYNITEIHHQKEWTREEVLQVKNVRESVPDSLSFVSKYGQFLFEPQCIPYESINEIPKVFTEFRKKCENQIEVNPVLPIPPARPKQNLIPETNQLPTLETLGFKSFLIHPNSACNFKGGEKEAQKRIDYYFFKSGKLGNYKKTRNGLIGLDYSSKLSAWLANGSISAKTVYWEVKRFEKEVVKNEDTYWLIFELIWRDFFKYISLKHGDDIFKIGGILQREYSWGTNEDLKNEWIAGNTREPFVNANMRELAATGFMSNRGRQNVASYWSKELGQDWRIGAAYFESMLIDYDVHSNWCNWMYNSGVGNDPRDRKFNTALQAKNYDPSGKYQRLWLQERLF